jgi:hypothetical protein
MTARTGGLRSLHRRYGHTDLSRGVQLLLEAILTVPLKEMRVRSIRQTVRRKCLTRFVDDRSYAIGIVRMPRDQHLQVIGQTNKTTIKHPMSRARKSYPIADYIWATLFNRTDMRRIHLCSSHSINQLQSGDSATFVIGSQHNSTKNPITHDPRNRNVDSISLLLKYERLLNFIKFHQRCRVTRPGQQRDFFLKAKFDYSVEVIWRDRTDCRLRTPRHSPVLIEHPLLDRSGSTVEGDRIGKVEIATGFDQSAIHSRDARIGNNGQNLCNCKISSRLRDFSRLVIDYPVADTRFDTTQILARKLILFSRAVFIDRIKAMNEYAKSHG